ncbi:MAG: hypothetical protein ACHQ1D_00535 [Nitrososphaerales archaeon]
MTLNPLKWGWFKKEVPINRNFVTIYCEGTSINLEFNIANKKTFAKMLANLIAGNLNKAIMINILSTLTDDGHDKEVNAIVNAIQSNDGPLISPAECFSNLSGEQHEQET